MQPQFVRGFFDARRRWGAVLAAVTGLLGAPVPVVRAQTLVPQGGAEQTAVVVLLDVSGSISRRPRGWHEALRRGLGAVLSGRHDNVEQWSLVRGAGSGPGEVLDALGRLGSVDLGVMKFGTPAAPPLYFRLDWQDAQSAAAMAATVLASFPAPEEFHQGSTFVDLAQAAAQQEAVRRGNRHAFFVVVSDFLNRATPSGEMGILVNRWRSGVLGLRETGRSSLQLDGDPNVQILVTRFERAITGPIVDSPVPGVAPSIPKPGTSGPVGPRPAGSDTASGSVQSPPAPRGTLALVLPLGRVQAGLVNFRWSVQSGADGYVLVVRGGPKSRPPVRVPGTSFQMSLPPAHYTWSGTARQSGRDLAKKEGAFDAYGGPPWDVLVAVAIIVASIVGWRWFRKRHDEAGRPEVG